MRSLSKVYKQVCLTPIAVLVGKEEKVNDDPLVDQFLQEDWKEKREEILSQAHREAQALLARAQEEVARIQEEAWKDGWEKGFAEGKREATEEARRILEEKIVLWESWLQEVHKTRQEFFHRLQEPMVEFAFALARKIIGREVEEHPFVTELVERVLQKLSNRERVIVRVNRNDYVRVKEMKEEFLRKIDGLGYLEIQEDPRVKEGGCLVGTVFGSIDAQIDTQLDNLREEIMKILREESHD